MQHHYASGFLWDIAVMKLIVFCVKDIMACIHEAFCWKDIMTCIHEAFCWKDIMACIHEAFCWKDIMACIHEAFCWKDIMACIHQAFCWKDIMACIHQAFCWKDIMACIHQAFCWKDIMACIHECWIFNKPQHVTLTKQQALRCLPIWQIIIPPPLPTQLNKVEGGYTGFTLSIGPSEDRIVFALYLLQYSLDPFQIYTSFQAISCV